MAIKINPMIIKSSYDYNSNTIIKNPNFESQLNFLKRLGYFHLGFNNMFESFKPIGMIANIGILNPNNIFVTKFLCAF